MTRLTSLRRHITVLSRVAAFLPQIAIANREIEEAVARDPGAAERFNVEHVTGEEANLIEMVGSEGAMGRVITRGSFVLTLRSETWIGRLRRGRRSDGDIISTRACSA